MQGHFKRLTLTMFNFVKLHYIHIYIHVYTYEHMYICTNAQLLKYYIFLSHCSYMNVIDFLCTFYDQRVDSFAHVLSH